MNAKKVLEVTGWEGYVSKLTGKQGTESIMFINQEGQPIYAVDYETKEISTTNGAPTEGDAFVENFNTLVSNGDLDEALTTNDTYDEVVELYAIGREGELVTYETELGTEKNMVINEVDGTLIPLPPDMRYTDKESAYDDAMKYINEQLTSLNEGIEQQQKNVGILSDLIEKIAADREELSLSN